MVFQLLFDSDKAIELFLHASRLETHNHRRSSKRGERGGFEKGWNLIGLGYIKKKIFVRPFVRRCRLPFVKVKRRCLEGRGRGGLVEVAGEGGGNTGALVRFLHCRDRFFSLIFLLFLFLLSCYPPSWEHLKKMSPFTTLPPCSTT